MEFSEKTFQILEALDTKSFETQRQLSAYSDISLGQVNYILKGLFEKGLVKIGKFKKNPNKIRYVYLLTPTGIEEKTRLAVKYVTNRLNKYHSLRRKMVDRLASIEKNGKDRVFFVGPKIVFDFIESIIIEKGINLALTGRCENWKDLAVQDSELFDVALIFDSNISGFSKIDITTGIPKKKIQPLW